MTSPMATSDYVEEMQRDKVVPAGAYGYEQLEIVPQKVTDGIAIEPVRHARVGGYRWVHAWGLWTLAAGGAGCCLPGPAADVCAWTSFTAYATAVAIASSDVASALRPCGVGPSICPHPKPCVTCCGF